METISISEFRIACFALLARVRKTGQPLRITRFGKPVADIHPPAPAKRQLQRHWLGSMQGTLEIRADIVVPSSDLVQWEAMR